MKKIRQILKSRVLGMLGKVSSNLGLRTGALYAS